MLKKNCLTCNKLFNFSPSQKSKFCSLQCYWKNRKGKTAVEFLGLEKATLRRIKVSKKLIGHKVSAESRFKIGSKNKGKKGNKGYKHSKESRKNMSNAKLASILSGKFSPQNNRFKSLTQRITTIKGGEIICQGSWEVSYASFLDQNNEVKSFTKDKLRLPYTFQGKSRVYITDFLVTYCSEEKELVEIKPSYLLTVGENAEKVKVASDWCRQNRVKFSIITETEIAKLPKVNLVVKASDLMETKCLFCEKMFSYDRRKYISRQYCNLSCAAYGNNRNRTEAQKVIAKQELIEKAVG